MNPLSYALKYTLDTGSSLVSEYCLLTTLPKTILKVGTSVLGRIENPLVNPLTQMIDLYNNANQQSPFAVPLRTAHSALSTIDSMLSIKWSETSIKSDELLASLKNEITNKDFWLKSGIPTMLETNIVGTHVLTGYAGAIMLNDFFGGVDNQIVDPVAAAVTIGMIDFIIYFPELVSNTVGFAKGLLSSDDGDSH